MNLLQDHFAHVEPDSDYTLAHKDSGVYLRQNYSHAVIM